jgi:hypothetical protein
VGRRSPRHVRRSGQPRADEGRSLNEEGLRPSATNAGKRRRWRASASTPYSALYGTSPVEVLTEGAVAAERYPLPEPSIGVPTPWTLAGIRYVNLFRLPHGHHSGMARFFGAGVTYVGVASPHRARHRRRVHRHCRPHQRR